MEINITIHDWPVLSTINNVAAIEIPVNALWCGSLLFASLAFLTIGLIAGYQYLFFKRRYSKDSLLHTVGHLMSELVVADPDADLEDLVNRLWNQFSNRRWWERKNARELIREELRKLHRNIAGSSSANLRWLYNHLQLEQDALERMRSGKWYEMAGAIQELGEMKQEKFVTKIYRQTNNKNNHVRDEAQIAIVRLTGFEGLRFLSIISHPLTEWQQLCLLEKLTLQKSPQWSNVHTWLKASNETVVEFSLRLIEKFKQYHFHGEVLYCLEHPSAVVRKQALKSLREIAGTNTASILEHYFLMSTREEKVLILEILSQIGSAQQLDFLLLQLKDADPAIRNAAFRTLDALGLSEQAEDSRVVVLDYSKVG